MPFDPTKPVQTRDGRKARIICTDASGEQPLVALITEPSGKEYPQEFTKDGFYYVTAQRSRSDLINIPVRRVRWANVYPNSVDGGYATQERADDCASLRRLGILKLIYENNEIVDHEYEKLK